MRTLAFLFALAFVACAHVPPAPDPGGATCEAVCAHGAELRCSWAEPTPQGGTCVEVCENASRVVPWNLDCLLASTECGPRVCP
jgi:hypothetical protein